MLYCVVVCDQDKSDHVWTENGDGCGGDHNNDYRVDHASQDDLWQERRNWNADVM